MTLLANSTRNCSCKYFNVSLRFIVSGSPYIFVTFSKDFIKFTNGTSTNDFEAIKTQLEIDIFGRGDPHKHFDVSHEHFPKDYFHV